MPEGLHVTSGVIMGFESVARRLRPGQPAIGAAGENGDVAAMSDGDSAGAPVAEPTGVALGRVLEDMLPGVDSKIVDWGTWETGGDPRYHRRGVRIADGELFVKFAWSQEAAGPIWREGKMLSILRHAGFPCPEVVALHPSIACFVTRTVPGESVTADGLGRLTGGQLNRFANQLADALLVLRAPGLRPALEELADPGPLRAQGTVEELHADFGPMVRPDQWPKVVELLDRVDAVLAQPGPEPVALHGDLHGYNLVWDGCDLAAVCDFENLTFGDPSYEVRYLPDNAPTQTYLRAVLNRLWHAGQEGQLERALAWHVLTRLGDARWRTLAGVDLPGRGNAAQWVDDLFTTLAEHGVLI